METPLPANILTCTQCGGELHPDEGQIFLTCPFCSSTVYFDKSRVVLHWYVAPTLEPGQAQAALRRWMTSSQTVKDLDDKSQIAPPAFEYFPLWVFKLRQRDGREELRLVPAAATAVSEITNLNLPAGDLRKYDQDIETQSHAPTVPLQAALEWAHNAPGSPAVTEQSLVHIPVYTFKYSYRNTSYLALVEGATGKVFANIYPTKAEAPYLAAGCLAALVYLFLALIPVVMGLSNGSEGGALGLAICTGLGLAAAPFLFGFAAWVAAKV